MSLEQPMDAAEEAAERLHQARIAYYRRELAEVPAEERAGTPWDPTLPAFLRRQAE
jgi:hypothetical protein